MLALRVISARESSRSESDGDAKEGNIIASISCSWRSTSASETGASPCLRTEVGEGWERMLAFCSRSSSVEQAVPGGEGRDGTSGEEPYIFKLDIPTRHTSTFVLTLTEELRRLSGVGGSSASRRDAAPGRGSFGLTVILRSVLLRPAPTHGNLLVALRANNCCADLGDVTRRWMQKRRCV